MRRPSTALAVLGSALLLAACGGGSHDDHEGSATGPAGAATATTAAAPESGADGATAAAGTPNAADVAFAQGMIPHHEQAVAMSEIALDPAVGAGPEVTDLATRIRAAQDPEIATMRGWLTAWGEEEIAEDHAAHGMEGMMSADELARLEQLEGAEFDRTWMEMMIRHHRGAITMSETVKQEGSLDAVEALADTIIAAQQKEIDEMQGLLDR